MKTNDEKGVVRLKLANFFLMVVVICLLGVQIRATHSWGYSGDITSSVVMKLPAQRVSIYQSSVETKVSEWTWTYISDYEAVLPPLAIAVTGSSADSLRKAEISYDNGLSWETIDLSRGAANLSKSLNKAEDLTTFRLRIEDSDSLSVWLEPLSKLEVRLLETPSLSGGEGKIALANWASVNSLITIQAVDSSGSYAGLIQTSGSRFRQPGFGEISGTVLPGEGLTVSVVPASNTVWPIQISVQDDSGTFQTLELVPNPETVNNPPVPWPSETIGPGGWTVYTQLGASIKDDTGNPDCSRGASVSGSVDISRGNSPYYDSCLYAYDSVNQVFFYRVRVNDMPLTPGGKNNGTYTGKDPWASNTYNLLIDLDGDGWKEFNVVLAGDSGGSKSTDISATPGSNDGDDLKIYYSNSPSQCVTSETVSNNQITDVGDLVWWGNAGTKAADVPPDQTADGATWDFGRTRCVYHTANNSTWNVGYFVDFQFPLSACTNAYNNGNGGTQMWGPHTPVTFGYTTSSSNTNPLQKDFASSYCYTPSCTTRFPYSDILTLVDGPSQNPVVGSMTISNITCPSQATVSVNVADALQVVPPDSGSGTVTDTIDSVTFQYYYDANGNGIADDGSTWTNMAVVGSSLNPDTNGDLAPDGTTASFNDWGVVWNTSALTSGNYIIRVIVVDDTNNSVTKIVGTYNLATGNCYVGSNPTWQSYSDSNATIQCDTFGTSPSCYVYMRGDFAPATTYNVAFYDPLGTRIQMRTILSQSFGSLEDSLFIDNTRMAGEYHSVVYPQSATPPETYNGIYDQSTNPFLADDTFIVTGPPVQSVPPIVSSPIYSGGSVTITGSSVEPEGSVITVYVDGNPVGTTTVEADGSWSLTNVSLTDGQVVTATAQASGETVSAPSNAVNVASNSGDLTPPPIITIPIYGEATCITGTSLPNATIDVYMDGMYLGTTTANGLGEWSLCGLNPLPEGSIVSATATISPTGTSIWSDPRVVGGIIHILRNDKVTSLTSFNPNDIFVRKSPCSPVLEPLGRNHYYDDGEGALLEGNGSSDDDDFYLRDVHQPVVDPDPTVLTDSNRPLVFYELIDNGANDRTIFLSKDGDVITITYSP